MQEHTDRLTRALERFFARDPVPGIRAAYLFGSHAERRAHGESDIDVAVLLDTGIYPTTRSRSQAKFELILELMDHLSLDEVDVVVLNDTPPELGRHVVQRGFRICASDPDLARAFERDVQLRAADLGPLLRRARESLLRHYVLR